MVRVIEGLSPLQVHICEGPTGEVLVRNLSSHLASSEEVAQSLLFQGSTCRRVAETSMNQSSSRSHTIFSITLTSKPAHSEVITRLGRGYMRLQYLPFSS